MKQTRTGKIACADRSCQRVATHKVQHPKRNYGTPYPTYYCEYHARSFPIAATFVSRTGFAVHTDDRHIMRKLGVM